MINPGKLQWSLSCSFFRCVFSTFIWQSGYIWHAGSVHRYSHSSCHWDCPPALAQLMGSFFCFSVHSNASRCSSLWDCVHTHTHTHTPTRMKMLKDAMHLGLGLCLMYFYTVNCRKTGCTQQNHQNFERNRSAGTVAALFSSQLNLFLV